MNKFVIVFFALLFSFSSFYAQDKKEILMIVNGNPVYASEFERVYKKNLELVHDESQKDVETYLNLFKDYKLKVAEAYAQKLDESASYKKEFSQYQDQLSRNYIFDDKVTEDLAREAYSRGLEEINAAHILVNANYEDTPQDTLAAYNKIKDIRQKALAGEDFDALAKKYSEEPNAEKTGGNLGYFSVFNLVYPFETMAYSTSVGKVSEIVRTQYGYHIIKVLDRRPRTPQIEVSHIMIATNTGERTFDPEERINDIYAKLQQGESFESLAKQFSDDKNSAVKGGKLNKFSKGDLRSLEFENAAYSLINEGDYTKPFKSEFGWHIVRLDEKFKTTSFEEEKEMLEKKAAEGGRSKIVTNAVNQKIKDKYGFKKGENYIPFFQSFVTDSILKRKWVFDTLTPTQNKVLFTIGDRPRMFADFANFLLIRQRNTKPYKSKSTLLFDFYDEFETQELKNYFKDQLEKENEDYAAILNEYRNGLLIFDVMNKNIWQKAKNDTLGLRRFYNNNKLNYNWTERITGQVFSANSQTMAAQVHQMLEAGKNADEIKTALNVNEKVNVIVTDGTFEMDARELPNNYHAKQGISEIYPLENSFVVVNASQVLPPTPKKFEEVKGKVISDYQNYLEEQWIIDLRKKYSIEVNDKILKKVKKELKS